MGTGAQASYSLGYDNTDELLSGSATGSSYGYTYDSGGNRLTETINGSTTTATPNAVNQLQELNPAKPGDKSYQWDTEDRLVGISYTGTGQQTQLSYDGLGRCAQIKELNNGAVTSTRRFLWCGAERCEERDGYDNVTKRFFNQGEQIWGQSYYFFKDHLGSIGEMTDSSGNIRASYKYDFWGRRTKISGDLDADFGFTGLFYHQPSSLCQAVFREYDANTGRWLARDPLGEGIDATLYSYVWNDPANMLDPFGLAGRNFNGQGDGGAATAAADASMMAYAVSVPTDFLQNIWNECNMVYVFEHMPASGLDWFAGASIKVGAYKCTKPFFPGAAEVFKAGAAPVALPFIVIDTEINFPSEMDAIPPLSWSQMPSTYSPQGASGGNGGTVSTGGASTGS